MDFEPWRVVTRREGAEVLARAARNLEKGPSYSSASEPHFADIPPSDPDFPYIEGLVSWGSIPPGDKLFRPDEVMDWNTLYQWLTALHLKASRELIQLGPRMKPGVSPKLVRWELARYLWSAIGNMPEFDPSSAGYLTAGSDVDHDGIPDLEDALPFDRDNNGIPDRLQIRPLNGQKAGAQTVSDNPPSLDPGTQRSNMNRRTFNKLAGIGAAYTLGTAIVGSAAEESPGILSSPRIRCQRSIQRHASHVVRSLGHLGPIVAYWWTPTFQIRTIGYWPASTPLITSQ